MERLVSERVLSPSVLPGRRSQPSRAPPVRLTPGITKTGGDKGASQFSVWSQTRASRRLLSFLQDWLPSLSSSIGLASFLHQRGAPHHCSPEFKRGPDQELEEWGGARRDERTGVFSSGWTLSVIACPFQTPSRCVLESRAASWSWNPGCSWQRLHTSIHSDRSSNCYASACLHAAGPDPSPPQPRASSHLITLARKIFRRLRLQ